MSKFIVSSVPIILFIKPVSYPMENPPMPKNFMVFRKNFEKLVSHPRYVSLLGKHVKIVSHTFKTWLKNKFRLRTNIFFAIIKGKTRLMELSTAPSVLMVVDLSTYDSRG